MKIKIGYLTQSILYTFRHRYEGLPQHLMIPFPIEVRYGKAHYEHR